MFLAGNLLTKTFVSVCSESFAACRLQEIGSEKDDLCCIPGGFIGLLVLVIHAVCLKWNIEFFRS